MIQDLANIVLNYFGGDIFEIIIIGTNYAYIAQSPHVTLNLKLNKSCIVHNKYGG